jgi:hypothetical protein
MIFLSSFVRFINFDLLRMVEKLGIAKFLITAWISAHLYSTLFV